MMPHRREVFVCLLLLSAIALGARLCGEGSPSAGITRAQALSSKAAFMEYGRRMRTGFAFQVRAMCRQNGEILTKFKAGGYDLHPDDFETETSSFCSALLESIQQFDGQAVPDVLERSHVQISRCHGLCYDSIEVLRKAYSSHGEERLRLLHLAESAAKKAWQTGYAGVKLHNETWERVTRENPW